MLARATAIAPPQFSICLVPLCPALRAGRFFCCCSLRLGDKRSSYRHGIGRRNEIWNDRGTEARNERERKREKTTAWLSLAREKDRASACIHLRRVFLLVYLRSCIFHASVTMATTCGARSFLMSSLSKEGTLNIFIFHRSRFSFLCRFRAIEISQQKGPSRITLGRDFRSLSISRVRISDETQSHEIIRYDFSAGFSIISRFL